MIFVDSNILLRLTSPRDPQRSAARRALSRLRKRPETLVVSTQVIAEAWAVGTRPGNQRGGLGFDYQTALRHRRNAERVFTLLLEPADLYVKWTALIDTHQIVGVNAHEARLVAVMTAYAASGRS